MPTNYSYYDLTGLYASTTYYFRIKTVCTNGLINYTSEYYFITKSIYGYSSTPDGLKSAEIGEDKIKTEIINTDFTISCYPNPATNALFVNISGSNDQLVELKLTNMVGQVVLNRKFLDNELQEIDVQSYSRGAYILVVKRLNESRTMKIVLK